jgi:hypothetical protein
MQQQQIKRQQMRHHLAQSETTGHRGAKKKAQVQNLSLSGASSRTGA